MSPRSSARPGERREIALGNAEAHVDAVDIAPLRNDVAMPHDHARGPAALLGLAQDLRETVPSATSFSICARTSRNQSTSFACANFTAAASFLRIESRPSGARFSHCSPGTG